MSRLRCKGYLLLSNLVTEMNKRKKDGFVLCGCVEHKQQTLTMLEDILPKYLIVEQVEKTPFYDSITTILAGARLLYVAVPVQREGETDGTEKKTERG